MSDITEFKVYNIFELRIDLLSIKVASKVIFGTISLEQKQCSSRHIFVHAEFQIVPLRHL